MRFNELAGLWRVPDQMFGDLSSLCLYDTLLLVDDSSCMAGALWHECMGIAQKLISLCTAFDDDGIEMMFFNSSVQVVSPTHALPPQLMTCTGLQLMTCTGLR